MRKGLQVARLLPAVLLMLVAGRAHAAPDLNCWLKSPQQQPVHWPTSTIPVYVSTAGLQGPPNDYDGAFLERVTRTAIARWNHQGGTPIRLKWAGQIASGTPAKAIVVKADPVTCTDTLAVAAPYTGGTAIITSGTVSLFKFGPSCVPRAPGYRQDPGFLVDVMVHELGHTMGRDDAYRKTDTSPPNLCEQAHPTVMSTEKEQDLTDFDRTDHQAVYGDRTNITHLWRRQLSGGTWSAAVDEGNYLWDVGPGPGSSYQFPDIPVMIVHLVNGISQIVVHNFNNITPWSGDVYMSSSYSVHKPVSAAYAPNGTGIMAYVVEDDYLLYGQRRVCYRTKYSTYWTNETCIEGCGPHRNGVSTAYDPVYGRFLIAYQCVGSSVNVTALPVPDCTTPECGQTSTTVTGISSAETPVIACSPSDATFNGTTYFGSNCRLVYARRNVAGQPLAWRLLGLYQIWNPYSPPSPPSFWVSGEYATGIESDHAPAVTWFQDRFYMALGVNDSQTEVYSMTPAQNFWVYNTIFYSDNTTTPGYISPPYLSATHWCRRFLGCFDQLHLFWFKYATPPCSSTASPSPCAG